MSTQRIRYLNKPVNPLRILSAYSAYSVVNRTLILYSVLEQP